jgi:2',3'-cyclic-nucleotide 2'-phosphodiesterase (5'-nucleotidase family)
LARRATVIKDLKNEVDEVLILDAGNSLFKPKGSPFANERKKARLIITAYNRMGYQAVNIGSDDLLAGIEFLKELQKGIHLPFLSANLLDGEAGKPIFKSHLIVNLGGIRVGIFGLTSDVLQNEGVTPEGYFISNPIAVAKGIVAELTKECDVIVALSNLSSFKEYTKLVQGAEGIHFIIGSGGKRSFRQIIRSDGDRNAFLFQARPRGQYLGRIELKFVKGSHNFVDLGQKANLERQINSIERQLDSYRRGTGRAKSIPQDKREVYIKKLEEFMKRTKTRLLAMERDSKRNSTFFHSTISLDDKVQDDPNIKGLIDQFKQGS